MLRLALVAAVFAVTACGPKEEAPSDTMTPGQALDSAANAAHNAAEAVDSIAGAAADSMKAAVDSLKH